MLAINKRFMTSVSSIALTAAMALAASTTQTQALPPTSANGTALPSGPGFNQFGSPTAITLVQSVEDEGLDPANAVTVTGIVYGTTLFPHSNAIGVNVFGWDIEASGATDVEFLVSPVSGATATNTATVTGQITGVFGHETFAPGHDSVGVLVADDIEAKDAYAYSYWFGPQFVSQTAVARNTTIVIGTVAGSSTNSTGLSVGDAIRAGDFPFDGAWAGVDVIGLTGYGSAQALNVVSIIGGVGGSGASPGSIGVEGGQVYAVNAYAGGESILVIPQVIPFPFFDAGSVLATDGSAAIDLRASNAVGIDGSVIADGGDGAIGVRILNDVFASEGGAFGEAISVGAAEGIGSAASGIVIASNAVSITGAGNGMESNNTGVDIGGQVYATYAMAAGEAISGADVADANSRIEVRANNVVSITGTAGTDNIGVAVGESANAQFAEAYGYAGANPDEHHNVANAFAEIVIDAGNTVQISGTATGDGAIGFQMSEGGVSASFAEANGVVTAYAQNDGTIAANNAVATAEGSVTAHNGVSITGTVADTISNGVGVDPIFVVIAHDATANGGFFSTAVSNQSAGGAQATATGTVLAVNAVDVTGTVGLSGSNSTGVDVLGYAAAYDAYASGSADATATANNFGIAANATATTNFTVQAINSATVEGGVGDLSTASTGVRIGQVVGTQGAYTDGYASANATVNGSNTIGSGGNAHAFAEGTFQAINSVGILGTVGVEGSGNNGVSIGAYLLFPVGLVSVDAQFAEAYGNTAAYAEAGAGVNVNATATANGTVLASNGIGIEGFVGADGSNNVGVFAEAGVFATFAEAGGVVRADAELEQRTTTGSTAIATAEGSILAQNQIAILGQVDPGNSYSAGVSIGEGVGASFAEANGFVSAAASMSEGANGNLTAQASGTIGASNLVTVGGTVGGTVGSAGSGNTGVWIGEGVSAYFAEAGFMPFVAPAPGGFFYAYADHLDGTTGDATASVGDAGGAGGPNRALVHADNSIAIQGIVADSDSLNPGLNNTGVYVGATVSSSFAEANGDFNASAYRDGPNNGNADASVYGAVNAANGVLIVGQVGQYATSSTGVIVDNIVGSLNAVEASFAEASGYASSNAQRNDNGAGNATAYSDLVVTAINQIGNTGIVGPAGIGNTGLRLDGSVEAFDAFAEGSANASASRTGTGAGGGIATATALTDVLGANAITIGGQVGDHNSNSNGMVIGGLVAAYNASAFAESNAYTYTGDPTGSGANGTQAATANATASATNTIAITGMVGSYVTDSYGVDPFSVSASNIVGPGYHAFASALASASGPEGGTASATATATTLNDIGLIGTVADHTTGSTGVNIINGVSATGAAADAEASVSVDNQSSQLALTGTATATATARNKVDVEGGVGNYSSNDYGVNIGGDVTVGDVKVGVAVTAQTAGDSFATAAATGTGLMENVVDLAGVVGNNSGASTGVRVGGNVLFNGDVSTSLSTANYSNTTALVTIEGFNRSNIQGQVGSNSPNSYGVYIGGNIQVTNDLVSNFVIVGSDATNDGTTRGVYIGGSVLTGDTEDSQISYGSAGNLLPAPVIPAPTQVGDYVELAGSVLIGANGGANAYGVDVAGGNDTVLVRDTHFQMDVVNGFNGGSNPDRDGQDVITFNNAQIYVSNLDNFEKLNVTNQSFVILTNQAALYQVKDYSPSDMTAQVNIDGHSVLAFGDGGTLPPTPEVSVPVNALTLNTEVLTIGGVNGVKSVVADDSILKAENNGNGNYTINVVKQQFDAGDQVGTVYNFGTITLSKVLSVVRGTDPHGIFYNSSTSFDSPGEQLYWATHGSWAIDPTSGAGDLLTINGNYVAGSDLILDAYVFKTGSASDKLVLNGEAAGTTTIWVNNTNTTGHGAYTGHGPTDGILLVDVNNGTQSPGDVTGKFTLGNTSGWNWADPVHFPIHEMQVGAFIYTLEQGGTDGKDFYLQSGLLDQVPGYAVASTALQQHFYAELGTLYQRLGELRHGDVAPRDNTKVQFWMRGVGEKNTVSPSGFGFDQTTYGFMIGGDYLWRNAIADKSRLHIGGFFGYGKSKVDNVDAASGDSSLKTDGWTVGAYATYFDTSRLGQGLYIDAVLKANFMSTDYSSSSRHTSAKNNDFAWGASLEAGYGFGLGSGFIIQPQGQLTYMQVTGDKFDESSTPGIPLSIDRAAADSLRGRLGLQLQNTWTDGATQFSPYLIGNVIHEFKGNNTTTVSGTSFRSDMGGTWYNAGGGMTVDFGHVGLYGHVEYTFGGNVEGIGGGLGLKYRW
ncbi:MAG: autotransporter outer membrane beta-barrel domain-containing protein [Rhodospirillales bacterium]